MIRVQENFYQANCISSKVIVLTQNIGDDVETMLQSLPRAVTTITLTLYSEHMYKTEQAAMTALLRLSVQFDLWPTAMMFLRYKHDTAISVFLNYRPKFTKPR